MGNANWNLYSGFTNFAVFMPVVALIKVVVSQDRMAFKDILTASQVVDTILVKLVDYGIEVSNVDISSS